MNGSSKGGEDVWMECMCTLRQVCIPRLALLCNTWGKGFFKIGLAGRSECLGSLKRSSMGVWFWTGFRAHLSASHDTGMFHRICTHVIRKTIDDRISDTFSPLFTSINDLEAVYYAFRSP
jgi:hypothetical protein